MQKRRPSLLPITFLTMALLALAAGGCSEDDPTQPAASNSDDLTLSAAIELAHGQGIIHRDVKALNVLLTDDLQPKVADFGAAKLATSSLQTVSGGIIGSPYTMSPEQASGEPADERSDVYSLGVVMYQMLLGRPPFTGEAMTVVMQHVQTPAPPVDGQDDSPEMPAELATMVMRMLAKEPGKRYPGMTEVRAALAGVPASAEPVEV